MFVKGTIAGDDGVVREVLTLGPIAMLQRHTANIASGFKRKAKSL